MAKNTKPRKRKEVKPKFRKLNELELLFRDKCNKYFQVLSLTMDVSLNQHGIDADGRGVRAVKIFTRQTLSGLSLSKILPRFSPNKDPDSELWDVCSLASLSRNILEGYLSIYYSGIEKVCDSEAELRFFIGQLHRNREWHKVHINRKSDGETLKQFEVGMIEQKERIKAHSYLANLTHAQRNKALKGDEMYYTKADFEKKNSICKGLIEEYQLLSNFVHPLPLSIERIDNDRGRGMSNDYDISYCLLCLNVATKYLAASTIGIIHHFPEKIGIKFQSESKSIRTFLTEDILNEFNNQSRRTHKCAATLGV